MKFSALRSWRPLDLSSFRGGIEIILPFRRRSGSVPMGGAATRVIGIVVSVGRTRTGVVLDGSSSRKVVISSSK